MVVLSTTRADDLPKSFIFLLLFSSISSGKTRIGTSDAVVAQDIVITGKDTQPEHCFIENSHNAVITLIPIGLCSVDGEDVTVQTRLTQGLYDDRQCPVARPVLTASMP